MTLLEQAAAAGVSGFLHPAELQKLYELAVEKDVLEIGAFMGLSAWGMAQTAKRVVSVDTFKANTAGQAQQEEFTTLEDYKRAVSGFDNVSYCIGKSEDATDAVYGDFDFIFLDAMHTYEDVKADIARWWPRVRPGGVMAFHDYSHGDFPGVKQAVDEAFGLPEPGTVLVTLRWIQKI